MRNDIIEELSIDDGIAWHGLRWIFMFVRWYGNLFGVRLLGNDLVLYV